MKKILHIIIYSWVLLGFANAQVIIEGKEIEANTPYTDNDYIFRARDHIKLMPGFSVNGGVGNEFRAYIDETVICDAEYLTGDDIPDVNSREINTSLPVGTTQGTFNVSPTGAATYTVPINTPVGTAGVQPQVAIAYNSQAGNGLLGMGWNISGLSAITRTAKTIYHDGYKMGVNLDENDVFALDGNRLILISGTYGGNNTTYKTEAYNFAAITSVDVNGNNIPESFTVESKDGTIATYAYSTTHKVSNDDGSKTLAWYVEKIEDVNGNYIKYNYTNNEEIGEFYIESIEYTGNSNQGMLPYNKVEFFYERRTSDPQFSFVASCRVEQNLLLRKVKVTHEEEIFRSYEFKYSSNFISHLNEIIEYDGDNNKYNSTIFNWGENNTIGGTTKRGNLYSNQPVKTFADVDGNGIMDIIQWWYNANDLKRYVALHKLDRNGNLYDHQELDHEFDFFDNIAGPVLSGDFNGDGNQDIALSRLTQNNDDEINGFAFDFAISNGDDFNDILYNVILEDEPGHPWDNNYFLNSGDFNGDGITDLIAIQTVCATVNGYYEHKVRLYLGSTDLSFSGPITYNLKAGAKDHAIEKLIASDFNGDGKTDLLFMMDNCSRLYPNTYGGFLGGSVSTYFNKSIDSYTTLFNSGNCVKPGDFNGDGKLDLLVFTDDSEWKILFHDGIKSFIEPTDAPVTLTTNPDNNDNKFCEVADFNGDGKSDIWEFTLSSGAINTQNMYYSRNGLSFEKEITSIDAGSNLGKMELFNFGSDMNSDGVADIFIHEYFNFNTHLLSFGNSKNTHLITDILNGVNQKTTIQYWSLQSELNYVKAPGVEYPLVNIQPNIWVVTRSEQPNGIGGNSYTYYDYDGALVHKTGKGFLGFSQISANNTTTFNRQETINEFDNADASLTKQIVNTYYSNTILNSVTTNTYDNISFGGNSNFAYVKKSVSDNKLSGLITTTDMVYNSSGYLTSQKSTSGVNYKLVAYSNFTSRGAPQLITTTSKHTDDANTFVVQKQIEYNSDGQVTETIDNFNKPNPVTTTINSYNVFGLPTSKTVSAFDVDPRTESKSYDSKGRFVLSVSTWLSADIFTYNTKTGTLLTSTDIIGNTTNYSYGPFNALESVTYPTGVIKNTEINWANGEGPQGNALYYTYTTQTGAPWVKTYNDIFGRTVLSESIGKGDIAVSGSTTYKTNGQIEKESSTVDGVVQTVDYTYYSDGRLESTTPSSGAIVNYTYNGTDVTTTVDRKGQGVNQVFTKEYDAAGKLVTATDAGGSINYTYYSHGGTKAIISNGNTVTMGYDEYGRQTSLNDPNAGLTHYTYDAIGQLKTQTDALGNSFTMEYDVLGRIEYKDDNNGNRTDYEYWTWGNGLGQLKTVTEYNDISTDYTYDEFGRVYTETESLPDGVSLESTYGYDSKGNITSVTYPSGITIDYSYDAIGSLEEISHGSTRIWESGTNSATSSTFSMNNGTLTTTCTFEPDGRLTEIKTMKGTTKLQEMDFVFQSATGNLYSRANTMASKSETFGYDELNRLTGITGSTTQSFVYDGTSGNTLGNLESKTDVGDFLYDDTRPNAISGMTNLAPGMESLAEQDITYTNFNSIATIEEGDHHLLVEYGPYQNRKKAVYTNNGSTQWTRYYGNAYERTDYNGSGTKEVTYISGDNGLAAVHIKTGGSEAWYYVLSDHLGSIVGLVDESGNIAEEYSYDAWGRRRNDDDWTYTNVAEPTLLDRGFTGHEHLDMFNLINMNGRVYDPLVGRFLSTDNYVQMPDNTQSYNRYAYCFNNPLIYTDPDGEIANFIIGGIIGGAVGLYTGLKTGATGWELAGYIGVGALAGAATSGVSAIATSAGAVGITAAGMGGAAGGAIAGAGNSAMSGGNGWDILSSASDGAALGAAGGSISHGIGVSIGDFSGVEGSGFKNAMYELGHSSLKGGAQGIGAGSIAAAMTQDASYLWKGAAFGSGFGAGMAGLRIVTMGAAIVPDQSKYGELEVMGQVYRRGSFFTAKGKGATIGRNLIVRQSGNVAKDRYLYHHETAHYKDLRAMGAYRFYTRTAKEYVAGMKRFGLANWKAGVHQTYGTLENHADYQVFKSQGYYWNGRATNEWNYGTY